LIILFFFLSTRIRPGRGRGMPPFSHRGDLASRRPRDGGRPLPPGEGPAGRAGSVNPSPRSRTRRSALVGVMIPSHKGHHTRCIFL
jgi:hypothetical protein